MRQIKSHLWPYFFKEYWFSVNINFNIVQKQKNNYIDQIQKKKFEKISTTTKHLLIVFTTNSDTFHNINMG